MATVQFSLQPWLAPNFARVSMPLGKREDGPTEYPAIAVADLSEEALRDLAEQWLSDLYDKAGKRNEWQFMPPSPVATA